MRVENIVLKQQVAMQRNTARMFDRCEPTMWMPVMTSTVVLERRKDGKAGLRRDCTAAHENAHKRHGSLLSRYG
jgi:hypothetical protein